MRILSIVTSAALTAIAFTAPTVPQSTDMGFITTPVASSTIAAGSVFPFSYAASNWCEEGYNHFNVFLTSGTLPPTFDDLDDDGDVPNALFVFGEFDVANFGTS